MFSRIYFVLIAIIFFASTGIAQDTLPRFTAVNKGKERIIISWTNPYAGSIRQLSIQRSFDSLKNFTTILTVPDPTVLQNGYVDSKANNDHMFYRLFILKDSGKYVFSNAKRPGTDDGLTNTNFIGSNLGNNKNGMMDLNKVKSLRDAGKALNERMIYVKNSDTLLGVIAESSLKRFRDSVNFQTRDTLFMKTSDTILIRYFVAKEYYKPSKFIFTEKDGNVKILLADAASRKYEVKFFEEDNTQVFEINHIKDPLVILDKTNFVHAGWFNFELYEDGKLKEKHKFYVPKDF